jgi:hypothetical protein
VTGIELFCELAELIPVAIEREYPGVPCCILATRIAIEVANYFGIEAEPVSCQLILYNEAFRQHLNRGEPPSNHHLWRVEDGAYPVGIGFGAGDPTRWAGHLVAFAPDCFGDFSISHGERREHKIITGAALVGRPRPTSDTWTAAYQNGTVAEYRIKENLSYRAAPDWKESSRRRRISSPIIRELQKRNGVIK